MARIASVQIAGYYPSPTELLSSFASILRLETSGRSYYTHTVFDPCAGDGEAIDAMRSHWLDGTGGLAKLQVVACEMEGQRARDLRSRLRDTDEAIHGDAFHLQWTQPDLTAPEDSGADDLGAAVLFLNPPYDYDPEHHRLEHRFLLRFASSIHRGRGILFYLVPFTVLQTSADYLARNFLDLRAWRLPPGHFENFGQVLVVARRSPTTLDPEPLRSQLVAWGRDPSAMPVLPEVCADPLVLEIGQWDDFSFKPSLRSFDIQGTATGFRPWDGIGAGTDLGVRQMLGARFHTAMPPKPAHIALALSSGMFNGHRLEPNEPRRHPPVLAKGIFERDLLEISERTNSEGETTGTVEVEQPRLRLTVLRLDDYTYHHLSPGVVPQGGDDPSLWNAADLIDNYRGSLVDLLRHQFPPLHDPTVPDDQIALPDLPRRPFRAQSHAIQAALKLLARGENPFLVAEVGTGKTTMALSLMAALSPEHRPETMRQLEALGHPVDKLPTVRRALVLCPPHLLDSWRDEAAAVVPEARVQVIRSIRDLDIEADLYVLSRETAKLGHRLRGMEGHCPRCGAALPNHAKANASRRLCCPNVQWTPANDFARLARRFAEAIFLAAPDSRVVRRFIPRRLVEPHDLHPMSARLDRSRLRFLVKPLLDAILSLLPTGDYRLHQLLHHLGDFARISGTESQVAEALRAASKDPDAAFHNQRRCQLTSETLLDPEAEPIETPTDHLLEFLRALVALSKWHRSAPCGEPLYQSLPSPRRYPLAKYIQRRHRHKFDAVIVDEAHEFSNARSAQTHALHRLVALKLPTVILTGSLMGGYASSLFPNFWALSKRFRKEFDRGDQRLFVDRYGYRKVFVQRKEKKEITERGVTTDREIPRGIKNLGEAPGILPTFLMQHLLPVSLLVHKDDLDHELPPMTETPIPLEPGDDARDDQLLAEYHRLQTVLLEKSARTNSPTVPASSSAPSSNCRPTSTEPPKTFRPSSSVTLSPSVWDSSIAASPFLRPTARPRSAGSSTSYANASPRARRCWSSSDTPEPPTCPSVSSGSSAKTSPNAPSGSTPRRSPPPSAKPGSTATSSGPTSRSSSSTPTPSAPASTTSSPSRPPSGTNSTIPPPLTARPTAASTGSAKPSPSPCSFRSMPTRPRNSAWTWWHAR